MGNESMEGTVNLATVCLNLYEDMEGKHWDRQRRINRYRGTMPFLRKWL